MSIEVLNRVGPQSGLSGTGVPSMTAYGSAIVQDDFTAAVNAGRMFAICSQAGVTSQAGLSATTPVLTLYNSSSTVNCRLWYAGCTVTVSAATAGAVWLAANTVTSAAAVTGTAATAMRNMKLGGSAPSITPLLAATLPAAPVGLCILGVLKTGAITTIPEQPAMGRWFNGGLIVANGTAITIQTGVASGASGLFCEYIWEEVAV